jgi:mannose-6-phosphate isomerase
VTHAELTRHLHAELLPLWLEHGRDAERGGFHARLDARLQPAAGDPKRLRVQTRMTWVFSRAALDGAGAWALDAAREGYAFLCDAFRDPRHDGWYCTLDPGGQPLERGKDLYDHAFVLLALATFARASGAAEPLALAWHTLELLDEKLADPEHGGYLEAGAEDWTPQRGARRQNPHMHLFEALLALQRAAPTGAALDRAGGILALLRERFIDRELGCLREHFSADWSRLAGPEGDLVEPGHHFEWAWLLAEYAELAGDPEARAEGVRLFDFAARHGLDPVHGGVFDRIDPIGRVLLASKRLWPQMEYLHALATGAAGPGALIPAARSAHPS